MAPEPETLPEPASILLVEDEVLIRLVMAEELRAAGFLVTEAARADEALSYLKAGGKPDLVFSDVHMPGSMNGLERARYIRERYPSVPIILTSGNIGPQSTAGLGLLLTKPYDVPRALGLITTLLGLASPGATA